MMRFRLLKRYTTALKFACSSLSSFVLDYVLFLLLSCITAPLAWGLLISNVAARLISALFNYALNKYMVFHGGGKTSQDLPQYVLLATGILCANSLLLHALTLLGLSAPLAKLLTELSLFLISFSVQSLVIFRRKDNKEKEVTIHVHS